MQVHCSWGRFLIEASPIDFCSGKLILIFLVEIINQSDSGFKILN